MTNENAEISRYRDAAFVAALSTSQQPDSDVVDAARKHGEQYFKTDRVAAQNGFREGAKWQAALSKHSDSDALLREAWSDIDTAPKDGIRIILAKHGWTTDMGDLKQGSDEWKARFFDDRAPKIHRCWWVARGYWNADRQKWTDGLDYLTEPTHWMPDFALPPVCQVPPAGWACTRKPGHDGPCAAVPAHLKQGDA